MEGGSDGVENLGMLESFMRTHQNSFKSLFQRKISQATQTGGSNAASPKSIPLLSSLANSVVSRSSKILGVPTEELQHRFDTELPEAVKQLPIYARNFLEFCSYLALHQLMNNADYLSDPDFRQLTFDIMLAWEAPSAETETENKDTVSPARQEVEDEDVWSLFYSSSTNMAVQVDEKKSVGREAFARIAPVCPAVADAITAHNLFEALTISSGHRLHFIIYDKYLRTLDKIIKAAKCSLGSSISSLLLANGEIVLDVDGANPVQPVLKHVGISAWPGKLTLTNYALYFESMGGAEKAIRYDLSEDLKQVIKPELTGPLGARLFDRAIMYKSISMSEPIYFEFPEFKGNARRDYWLGICLEILRAHQFIRKYNFKEVQKSEVLAGASLAIFRYRAVREAFQVFSSQYKTLLAFNLAESLPGGDLVLEALSSRLARVCARRPCDVASFQYTKWPTKLSPVALLVLKHFGLDLQDEDNLGEEITMLGDFCVGDTSPLEIAVEQSILNTGKVEAAQATVDKVKVEGIDTNFAVMKELLFPLIQLANCIQRFASWEDPIKSTVFVVLTSYAIIRGWISYILPSTFAVFAIMILWCRHFNKGKVREAIRITHPPNKNAVEQLLSLQEAISQVEAVIQTGNVILLKIRAILLAILPQATDTTALLLVFLAATLAFVPLRFLFLLVYVETFTREHPWRKESSDRVQRRMREWWVRIPAAPVQLVRAAENKKNK